MVRNETKSKNGDALSLEQEVERLRKRLAEVEESERKYRTLFDMMIDGYALHEIICDDKGKPVDYRFLDLNPSFENLTKLPRAILGKTVREVIPGIEDSWIETYGKVALTGEPVIFDSYAEPLGKWFKVVAFRPGEGQFAVIFTDITNEKRALEELRQLRNLLSNIVNSMPSVLIGVDVDCRVTQWNLEAEKETGISADDARGKVFTDVFPRLAVELENVHRAIHERQPLEDRKVQAEKDGEVRYSDITVYPLIANGVRGAVIRMDDVTDRVRIEEMMVQSEKMLSVGTMAAGIAHEINNPLAGIIQNMQVMTRRFSDELPRNRKVAEACGIDMDTLMEYVKQRGIDKMMEGVLESGRRAARLVHNMLNFSRKSDSVKRPCDLRNLLDQTLELASSDYDLKKKYDFRQIEIKKEYHPGTPYVKCEESKIQQVLLNLLKNGAHAMARKFKDSEAQGWVAGDEGIEHPRFTMRVAPEPQPGEEESGGPPMVLLEIGDNGAGMDDETVKRVFEPFFTTKRLGTGTGLGLSVSLFIIAQDHGGTMDVESTPGKGTKFIIRLPVAGGNQ